MTIDSAWRGFRRALADAVDGLGDGEWLSVALDPGEALEVVDRALPGVELGREGASIVLEAPGNRVLPADRRLSAAGQRLLRGLGLRRGSRTDPTYRATYPLSHVDEAAAVAVAVLRDVFDVVHPAFLASDGFSWEHGPRPEPAAPGPETEGPVQPVNRAHLDHLVDAALARMIGHTPARDSDGDIPFPSGTAVVFVSTSPASPVVRVFAEMVVEIRDLDAAVREIEVLNREIFGVKFSLHDDRIVASVDLLAMPFVGDHLRALVARMIEVVAANDALAARRVSGRTFLGSDDADDDDEDDECEDESDESDDDAIHPVMLRLIQLDAERPGSVRPKDAARLCDHDPDLILELIRWNEEQEISWRQARDEAMATHEYDEAEACEGERAHAARTVKVLRKALRIVLLA
ncbi:YbjN domain-containing protein [Intrasporangium calvum]|uniref:YbjN domain-containing protein n=1 Tax=Intrasporangium calvum TaxID=53358 RepID=A0ABT5GE68_9MICO|nr:hypothetical protein [Intrasporangium calvum]MDC5696553.1 YbjN domain-containing protein [Intrasporangium calvum]